MSERYDDFKYLILIVIIFITFLVIHRYQTIEVDKFSSFDMESVHGQETSLPVEITEKAHGNLTQIQTKMPFKNDITSTCQISNADLHHQTETIDVAMEIKNEEPEIHYPENQLNEFPLVTCENKQLTRTPIINTDEQLANHEIFIGDRSRPIVIMTYDDGGPAYYIDHIMSIYEAYDFTATFFITGIWAERNSDLVREMIDRGFTIGFHGWDHCVMTALTEEQVREQITRFFDLMKQIDEDYEVSFIRFPYGERNQFVRDIAAEYGLQSVMWSCGSGGFDKKTIDNILRCLENGAIVLSHSTRWYDVFGTEDILQVFVDLGYEAVSISEGLINNSFDSHENSNCLSK